MKKAIYFATIIVLISLPLACRAGVDFSGNDQPTSSPSATSTPIKVINITATTQVQITKTPTPELLTDKEWIAFINNDNIWLLHPDGSDLTQITTNSKGNLRIQSLAWSPDGLTLAYSQRASDKIGLFLYDVNTSTTVELIAEIGGGFDWLQTGKQIIYDTPVTKGIPGQQKNNGIWLINLKSNRVRQIVTTTKSLPVLMAPQRSPTGSHLIFTTPCFEANCVGHGVSNFRTGDSFVFSILGGPCKWSPVGMNIGCIKTEMDNSTGKNIQKVVVLDEKGNLLKEFLTPEGIGDQVVIEWSPAGTMLAIGYYSNGNSITDLLSLETGDRSKFTNGLPLDWSPDGHWLLTFDGGINKPSMILITNSMTGVSSVLTEGWQADWQP